MTWICAEPQKPVWATFTQLVRAHALLSDPARDHALDRFREQLVAAFGEEPTVDLMLNVPIYGPDDVLELSLADYVGLCLPVRHAAVYQADPVNGILRCVAAFGHHVEALHSDSELFRWVVEHGSLLRSTLSLDDLSVSHAQRLLDELEGLQAELIVPCVLNESLTSLLVIGPPVMGAYGLTECLRLGLYSIAILGCRQRRALNLPTKTEIRRKEELEAFKSLKALWFAMKPTVPIPLLLLDEMPKVVERLTRYFTACGFWVQGTTREEDARQIVASRRPPCLIVDLSLFQRMPLRLLEDAARYCPGAIVLGTTTGFADHHEAVAMEFGVTTICRKPLHVMRLASGLFEAVLDRHVRGTLALPPRGREPG